jgi:MFS family permease
VTWFTLREPRFEGSYRGDGAGQFAFASHSLFKTTATSAATPRLKDVAFAIWTNHTLRHLLFFWSAASFVLWGLARWQPAFFVRSHGMTTGNVGTGFAIAFGVGGTLGPLLGGAWAARYAVNNERLLLRVAAGIWCAATILSVCIYLVPNPVLAFALLALFMVLNTVIFGPFWALVQNLAPPSMRATAAALFMLASNLLGTGLGPLSAGILSDSLRPRFGNESLRYSLVLLSCGFLWAAWHLWKASQSVTCDLAVAEAASR